MTDLPSDPNIAHEDTSRDIRRLVMVVLGIVLILFFAIYSLLYVLNTAPPAFVPPTTIEIEQGLSLIDIAQQLEEHNIVRSALLFQSAVHFFHDESQVRAGFYELTEPYTTLALAEIFTSGKEGRPIVRLTIPEGLRIQDIDPLVAKLLKNVAPGDFTLAAAEKEGYLFPDTYFLEDSSTADDVVAIMEENFEDKLGPLQEDIEMSDRTLQEVITMASIIEKEAGEGVSKGLVAGILWDRFDIGMPLQADATVGYTFEKPLSELSADDLDTDTPYNTYLYRGLPPTPIGNPGIDAIHAAIDPTTSPYLYYITDPDGEFHYAVTFEEHKENIERHLRD